MRRPPCCLANTFCLVQLLWRLSSSSTLLCFALFFVLVKISEILSIGQILLSVCFVSKSIKTKIFSHHVIDQQTVNKLMLSCATKLAVPSRWETNLTLSGANQNGLKIHFISSCHIVSHYIIERFHSHGQHLCKFMGAKEIVYIRRVQLPQDLFGTPT